MKAKHCFLVTMAAIVVLLLVPLPAAARQTQSAPQAPGDGASIGRAIDYLKGRQQSDGGFAEPGKGTSELLTMWAVCGLSAAGQDMSGWRRSGKTPVDYLAARASKLTKLTDIEKACLAVSCAGEDPRSFGGRNLVADIKAKMAPDGHIGDLVNEHCWGVIALKAAGETLPEGSRKWLVARQNIDGGFGYGVDTGSDPDDSGAALQALVAVGENPQGNAIKRVISYLRFCQAGDAGFTYNAEESNVGSTAWAVQGIVAAGQDPASSEWVRSGRTPIDYLAGTQQADGHFRYMRSSDANPAWMTAEALPALSKKAYPLKPGSVPGRTDPAPASAKTQGTTPQETDPGAATSDGTTGPGEAASGNSGEGTPNGERNGAGTTGDGRTLAAGKSVAGGVFQRGRSNGLAVFAVACALYLVMLGLAYVSLSYFYTVKKERQ
jgi:iron complex transport system substrate-binding protein